MTWTDERINKLKNLWQKGMTTVEIGKALGVSKNAVVGKAHRLGLDARPSPIKRESMPAAKEDKRVVIPVKSAGKEKVKDSSKNKKADSEKPSAVPIPQGRMVSLLDLHQNSCRWPIGDPKDADFHFCDKDAIEGKPYCLDHCAEAYVGINKFLKSHR